MGLPKIILVVGPMSTGTRIFTRLLSEHPNIRGLEEGDDHYDIMDDIWEHLRLDEYIELNGKFIRLLKANADYDYIVTRRSMPHGTLVGQSGESYFPNISNFIDMVTTHTQLAVFVTSRNPLAALESAKRNRYAAQGDREIAWELYQEALNAIFWSMPDKSDLAFLGSYIVSLEGLFYEKHNYLNGMLNLLSLPPMKETNTQIEDGLNETYYDEIRNTHK